VHTAPSFFTHILFFSYAFRCLLTPSSGSFNPPAVPSQHIKYLRTLISSLLKTEVSSQTHHFFYHLSFSVKRITSEGLRADS